MRVPWTMCSMRMGGSRGPSSLYSPHIVEDEFLRFLRIHRRFIVVCFDRGVRGLGQGAQPFLLADPRASKLPLYGVLRKFASSLRSSSEVRVKLRLVASCLREKATS